MEPAEPLNRGSREIKATFTSVLITIYFQGVPSKVEADTGSPEDGEVLGTAREMFSWLSVWV